METSTATPPTATKGAWRQGAAVSAGGGRGLGPALKEPPRVIAHIDMDAFYAQIEQLRDTALTGKPVVVVQYPTSRHDIEDMRPDDNRVVEGSASSIIAVSYEARPSGVKRGMKAADARKLCPELSLVQVPTRNGKADISLYRHAGEKVVGVLERAGGPTTAVEKASIDEVYVDVTRAAQALLSGLRGGDGVQAQRPERQDERLQQQQQQHEGMAAKEKGETEKCADEKGSKTQTAPPGEEQKRGPRRWEDIGEGGWAAVVLEAAGTHVAGLQKDDDDDHDDQDAAKQQQASREGYWWGRPMGELTEDELLLGCGAAVVSTLRAAVRSELGYSCTAGVAHNKLLAKLCSNMHKPNAQTVLPLDKVERVFHTLPVERVRGWGGKFGVKIMEKLGVTTAGDVAAVGASELQRVLGDEEGWKAWEKSNGVDRDPVKARSAPKSIGCSKTFPGKAKLTSLAEIERWLSELSKELVLRLEEQRETDAQTPTKLTVSFAEIQKKGHPKAVSRCCRMVSVEVSAVVEACLKMVKAYKTEVPRLSMLGVSVHGFEDSRKSTPSIQSFFGAAAAVAVAAAPASGGAAGRSSMSFPRSLLPRKPAARVPSSSSSSSSSSRPNGLGFPTATGARREAGVKRRRPWGSAGEHAGVGAAAVTRRVEGDPPHTGAGAGAGDGDGDGDDHHSSSASGGGGGKPREGVSVDSATGSDDLEQDTRETRQAGAGTARRAGGGRPQGEFAGGVDADVRCEGVRNCDTGKGGDGEKPTGGPEGDDGVQFCGVLQGGGESSDSQACEVVVPTQNTGAAREANEAASECLVTGGGGQGPGEGRRSRSSSRGLEEAEALAHPRAMFGRGGASGVFGEVDPGVLAELPPEIQREIWMQQGRDNFNSEAPEKESLHQALGAHWGKGADEGGGAGVGGGPDDAEEGEGGGHKRGVGQARSRPSSGGSMTSHEPRLTVEPFFGSRSRTLAVPLDATEKHFGLETKRFLFESVDRGVSPEG
eukprot:g12345.t1